MFSGNEWLILVIGVVVVIVIVLLLTQARRDRNPPISSAVVNGPPDQVIRDLVLALSGSRNTTVRTDGSASVIVEWSFIPPWAVFLAIILFPIGLLALVARTSVSGSVVADLDGALTRLRMAGSFNKTSVRAVNAVIDSRS